MTPRMGLVHCARRRRDIRFAVALGSLCCAAVASADVISVPLDLCGGYNSAGGFSNSPAFQNYRVGLSPITTTPWGQAIPKLASVPAPSQEMRDGELLYNEPKYIRLDDGGLRSLEAAGLKLKKGVTY